MLPGAFDLKKMRPPGVNRSLIKGQDEKILRLKHSVTSESESCARNLIVGVLMSVSQTRQASHTHHDHAVASGHGNARRSLGDLNMDVEARGHSGDSRDMGEIDARGELAILSHSANSINVKDLTGDSAVAGKHAIGDSKSKVSSHLCIILSDN